MSRIDDTHNAARTSWVASANGHADFPIQNLPIGIFAPRGDTQFRGGVAIGDSILDLAAVLKSGAVSGSAGDAIAACAGETLNAFLAMGTEARREFRHAVFKLLEAGATAQPEWLHDAADCTMGLPVEVGDYTDFYAGIHHATNVGRLFRPDNPLLPNYKYIPIGYHGRASSVVPSGSDVFRPSGQRKPPTEDVPSFGACRNLDYELELGVVLARGNARGTPVPIAEAADYIGGYCLLNDWSARDVQGWEYVPLGPFLAKSFATTISPWLVTPEALAPFRIAQPARPAGDPAPLPYLLDEADQGSGACAIDLDVSILTPTMRERGLAPEHLARTNARHLYWTVAQMVAHHASGGCNLRVGDLLGTGTISGPDAGGFGSLLETTEGGKSPLTLGSGETRRFLEDGDEVIIEGRASRDGYATIGFGTCRGTIR